MKQNSGAALRIKKNYIVIFISTLMIGFVTHGVTLTNKFSSYDDIHSMFATAASFSSGRWMLGIMDYLVRNLTGGDFSLPLFNGTVSLIFLAITVCIMAELYNVQNTLPLVLMSAVMVTFPSLTGTFGFVFTAPFYMAAVCATFLGVYFICAGKHSVIRALGGAALIACGMGVYQAYLPFAVAAIVIYMFFWTADTQDLSWKKYILEGIYYVGTLVLAGVIYLVCMKLSLAVTGLSLTDYKGINTLGYAGVRGYLERLVRSYKEFFYPSLDEDFQRYNMYPGTMRVVYYLVLAAIFILLVRQCIRSFKSSGVSRVIQILLLAAVFPAAANLIFLMTREWFIYALITYAECMTFIWLILMACRESGEEKFTRVMYPVAMGLIIISGIYYCRLANICYLKQELMVSEATSYLTTMITRIQSTPGYREDMPVAFLNDQEKSDMNWADIPELDFIVYEPYTWDIQINSESWTGFMKYYCGYEPKNMITDEEELEEIKEWPEVQDMPNYPDDGAIQIINGTIVIKF